jgi:UvrD-like helicase C-terminal domain/AAA domain
MPVLIDQSFPVAVTKLASNEAKRVWLFLGKFLENPAHPSLSLERVTKTKNQDLWSARISQELRAIIYKDGDDWVVLYAGHHDDAYAWASSKQVGRHSKTGVLQIVALPEILSQQIQQLDGMPPTALGLLDAHQDDYLISLGLPENWLPTLRKIQTEEVLLDVIQELPEDVGERLLRLATGELVTPPPEPQPNQSIVQQAQNQRFFVLDENADFLRMLEAPLATWIAFLHPSQQKLATGSFNGPLKITGAAGTGKTVVALHRARHLARQGKRVLLTSYVKTLCENLERNLALLCTPEELGRITVSTVHKQALKIAIAKGQKIIPVDSQAVKMLIEAAHVPSCPLDPSLLTAEWEAIVQDQGINSWSEYQAASRKGRGLSLSVNGREQVWPIFEKVQTILKAKGEATWSNICCQAREFINSGIIESPFDVVLVDELQDLRPQELQLLVALAGDKPNSLTLLGDGGQRIYGGGFSLKGLGINVQGRSHILRINYRTTEQIRRFADRLLGDSGDDLDGGKEKRSTISLLKGPVPTLHPVKTLAQQWKYVSGEIKRMKKEGLDLSEIAIFSRTNTSIEAIQTALQRNRISSQLLQQEQVRREGVQIGTLHRAKGLEFKAVFVVNVSDEYLPLRSLLHNVQDQQLRTELLERERQLLYVGLTRARDEAVITWAGYPSQFLEDILTDPELEALESTEEDE